MRGLRYGSARRARAGAAARLGAVAAALTAVTACASGGMGTRDEGPARTQPYVSPAPSASQQPAAPPSPSATAPSAPPPRVDGVKLVLDDPRASSKIKKELRPCDANGYPVDVSYGSLTGGSSGVDVVVNVMTCDAISLASYVYRPTERKVAFGRYLEIFRQEESPVYATIDRGDLVVTMKVYEQDDAVAYPSGEDVIVYRWSREAGRFAEQSRTHNDYSRAVGGASPSAPDK